MFWDEMRPTWIWLMIFSYELKYLKVVVVRHICGLI